MMELFLKLVGSAILVFAVFGGLALLAVASRIRKIKIGKVEIEEEE